MSDTPSTDAIAHHGYDEKTYIGHMTAHARELERENARLRDALTGCLAKLKHHHISRRGIRTIIRNAEHTANTSRETARP
jgi:hypothetical protein